MLPLSIPHLAGNEWTYVKECLDTGWVSSVGSYVTRFEESVAAYLGVSNAVAVVNGTSALHLALLAVGVRPGDVVLVPSLSFIATANAVRYCGADPVFFDIDPQTLCISVEDIRKFLTERAECRSDGTYDRRSGRRIAAVIPVHIFGHPCDMDPLCASAEEFNIPIVEDAAESIGSEYKGKKTGGIGRVGCLSFNGNKIITTGGGGMVVTNDAAVAAFVRHMSTQANRDPAIYDHDAVGYNYRLTNIQAALGVAQMEQLDMFIKIKRRNAEQYQALFAPHPSITFLTEMPWANGNRWFYTVLVPAEAKDRVLQHLAAQQIQVRPLWKVLPTLSMYTKNEVVSSTRAMEAWQRGINIPCSVSLTYTDIERVVRAFISVLK